MELNHDLRDFTPAHIYPFCQSTICLRWIWLIFFSSSPNSFINKLYFNHGVTKTLSNTENFPVFHCVPLSLWFIFADEERFELSTLPLTTGRSAVELFIQSNWPMRFPACRQAGNSYLHSGALPIKRHPIFLYSWPGEIRTHNLPVKSREHLSSWATSHFVATVRFELTTITL